MCVRVCMHVSLCVCVRACVWVMCVCVCVCVYVFAMILLAPGVCVTSTLHKSHDHVLVVKWGWWGTRLHLLVQWHLEVFSVYQRGAGLKLEPETGLMSDP